MLPGQPGGIAKKGVPVNLTFLIATVKNRGYFPNL